MKTSKVYIRRRRFRELHRPEGMYQFKIGRAYVVIYDPDNNKCVIHHKELLGMNQYDWERASYKGGARITPGLINDWISK